MVSQAGIGLFLFGNRRDDGDGFEPAEGVLEEFEIAVGAGLAVVPVGATGHMAAELHRRVLADFDEYFPGRSDLRPAFEKLSVRGTDEALVEHVVQFLGRLREEG